MTDKEKLIKNLIKYSEKFTEYEDLITNKKMLTYRF